MPTHERPSPAPPCPSDLNSQPVQTSKLPKQFETSYWNSILPCGLFKLSSIQSVQRSICHLLTLSIWKSIQTLQRGQIQSLSIWKFEVCAFEKHINFELFSVWRVRSKHNYHFQPFKDWGCAMFAIPQARKVHGKLHLSFRWSCEGQKSCSLMMNKSRAALSKQPRIIALKNLCVSQPSAFSRLELWYLRF